MFESLSLKIAFGVGLLGLWTFAGAYLFRKEQFLETVNKIIFGSIFISLIINLSTRGLRLERFPISNLYETLILMACLLAGAYVFLLIKYKLNFLNWAVCILLLGFLIYALWLPGAQKEGTPLIPALQSYWRIIHVPPLLASYAFFCLAALSGIFYLTQKQEFYGEIIYRCISFGFPLLTFGIVTGALWANHAWGNLWQWDPKENLALVTWFCYAAYLHLKITGKASQTVQAWVAIAGLIATYMTYLGINQFDLGGLHTYGKV